MRKTEFMNRSIVIVLLFCLFLIAATSSKRIHRQQQHHHQQLDVGKKTSSSPLSKISIDGKWFVDQDGRVILFRGINAVQKSYPWIPKYGHQDLTNKTQLAYLKEWGFNAIRLGYMWSGVYPGKNQLNQTYINAMTDIINELATYGIYVIIDMHQDMGSSKYNAYDGIPLWLVNDFPPPKHAYPWPFKNISFDSFESYLSEACSFGFQCLYSNVSSSQDYFQQFWSTIAQTYKGFSSVLSYELINEPWAGDIYSNPTIFLPGNAGHKNLLPLYDNVYPFIRKYDPDTIVMYEPVTWGIMSNKQVLGTGFDHAPGHDPKRTALSWHYYCWIIQIDSDPLKNGTYPIFDRVFCDDWQLNDYFHSVEVEVEKNLGNGPSFLTEFGTCSLLIPNQTDPHKFNNDECRVILEAADRHIESWTYWDSNFYYDDTYQLRYDLIDLFSRTYPMATNGEPQSLNYDVETKRFQYIYNVNITSIKQANLNTEIFVPKHAYPNGFTVDVSSFLTWYYVPADNKIYLKLKSEVLSALEDLFASSTATVKNLFQQQAKISITPK